MHLNPYLTFNGQCEAAFRFYAECLGGQIVAIMTHADAPAEAQISPEWRNKIMHARLAVGDTLLMGSDSPPAHHENIKGCSVALQIETPAEAERVFKALAAQGTVQMPLQETFWAQRFGMLVDRFGVPWFINCEKPQE